MRLARHPATRLEGNPQRVADLSVRAATALLAKHKSPNINTDKSQDAVRSERESLNKKIKALGKGLEQQRDGVLFLWTPAATDADIAALVGELVASSTRPGCRTDVRERALMVMRSKGCADAPLEPLRAFIRGGQPGCCIILDWGRRLSGRNCGEVLLRWIAREARRNLLTRASQAESYGPV